MRPVVPEAADGAPRCGSEGLIVYRRSSNEGDWLCDLWLAERIAAAVGT